MPSLRKVPLCVKDAYFLEGVRHKDDRGFFQELFQYEKYPTECKTWKQVSQSYNVPHVMRGIHRSLYTKVVTCMQGSCYDFVVDLRDDSPTYLQWACVELTDENRRQMYIPPRCGHGFISSKEGCTILYLQEGTFDPPNELDFLWNDNAIGVRWNEPPNVIMSAKDKIAPTVESRFGSIPYKNDAKRVLVIGASGQLGTALCKLWRGSVGTHSTVSGASHCLIHYDLQTATESDAAWLLEAVRPDILCVCGGFTWVDGCERDPAKAMAVNCDGPALLAKLASSRFRAKVVTYSTDYVFDGSKGSPYREDDPVCPMNAYGRSKLEGEKKIVEAAPDALIIRTSVVYGPDPQKKNFACQMLRTQHAGETKKVPTDQVACPSYLVDLARMTKLLMEKDAKGIYNVVGSEILGRFDFGEKIAPGVGVGFLTTNVDLPTPRPLYCALDNSKAKEFLGKDFEMRGVEDAMADWAPTKDDVVQ